MINSGSAKQTPQAGHKSVDGISMIDNAAGKIFLYGPPLSGKSTIGQHLADRLALPFLDLDNFIENQSGLSIPEIFAAEGETGFRTRERADLIRVLEMDWGVIALGGGTLLDPRNRAQVEASGSVLCLSAPDKELLLRLQTASDQRPLLSEKDDGTMTGSRLRGLLADRASHYASFAGQLATESKSPPEVAWEAQVQTGAFHVSGMVPQRYKLDSPIGNPPRPHPMGYDVRIKKGSLDSLGNELKLHNMSGPIAIVSDENVGEIYMHRALKSLQEAGYASQPIIIPPGESSKNIPTISTLWEKLLAAGIERGSIVVALGGGVVGDLSGFAAATYMRGISWVILPTSLLAMVDASLGGKTGADLPQGKNLVGAFHAPHFVLVDPKTLDSLPMEEVKSGMAEVVKAGIIGDPTLYEICSQGWTSLDSNWDEVVRRAMAVKIRVIESDPYEAGIRKTLNLGHTIGHAVELVSDFNLRHGEAVAIGMVAEAYLAEQIGLADQGLAKEIKRTLSGLDLPTEIPSSLDRKAIFDAILVDKKRSGGQARFALPVRVGEVKPDIVVQDLATLLF
jgi:shikimate kinase/3-dehydroquinate synthase